MSAAVRTLRTRRLRDQDYASLESRINEVLWETVFASVVALVKAELPKAARKSLPELENSSESVLRSALRDGKVQLSVDPGKKRAVFTVVGGASNRALSDSLRSFGARYDKTISAFSCPSGDVPPWVSAAAQAYSQQARDAHARMLTLLEDLDDKADAVVQRMITSEHAGGVVADASDSWKAAAKSLEVGEDLSATGRRGLEESLSESVKIPVKEFTHEMISELRREVEANATRGYRMEGLAKRVAERYGVSKSRANLIALQETSNFMADFREARAKDAGLTRYVWMCSMDGKERPDHRKLHGTTQSYDNPPVVCQKTGKRGNPGTDFRCRCVDLPVVE